MINIKSSYNESMLSFLVVFGLALPISFGGFVLSYAYSYLVLFYILLLNKNNDVIIGKNSLIIISILLVSLVTSGFYDSLTAIDYWYLRELIRIPLMLILLVSFNINRDRFLHFLGFYLSLLILCDFVFLYLLSDTGFTLLIKKAVAMSGMTDYLDGYWRHMGLGGNPNFSSFIYAISIIVLSWLLVSFKHRKLIFILFLSTAFIALFLLVISYSRTSLVALLLAVFFIYFRLKYLFFIVLLLLFGITFLLFNDSVYESLITRFSSFSSFDARVEMWKALIESSGPFTFLFGNALPVDVVDNDYLYFFYRFGFIVALILLIIPIYIYFQIRYDKYCKLYLCILIFFYVAAFPGGTFTHPKTFFFLIFLSSILYVRKKNFE